MWSMGIKAFCNDYILPIWKWQFWFCPMMIITSLLYLPIYLPVYLHTYLSSYLPFHIPIHQPTYLFTNIPTYLPNLLTTYLPTYLATYLPTYLTTYLPACLTHSHLIYPLFACSCLTAALHIQKLCFLDIVLLCILGKFSDQSEFFLPFYESENNKEQQGKSVRQTAPFSSTKWSRSFSYFFPYPYNFFKLAFHDFETVCF